MSKLQHTCPVCQHRAELQSEFKIGNLISRTYACHHVQTFQIPSEKDFKDFVSLDGYKPRSFQITGAVFGLNSGGRFLIMDDPGIGKTIQFLMVAKKLKKKFLVICKSGLKVQWMREIQRWCGEDYIAQIIKGENDFIIPCKAYIISFDTLWRFKDIPAFVKSLGIDVVGLDEVQHIKNSSSKRTQGVREVCREVTYVGALSGTPIEKHAGEFFTILNILRPDKFYTKANYEQVWVETYFNGRTLKYGGLKDAKRFKEYTKDFIIRRTREEVLPELPTVSRNFMFSELGPAVEEAYKETFRAFQQYYNFGGIEDTAFVRSSNILAYLTKMRHLTGIAKINPVIDYVTDFIEETDRKIVIFLHHKDVGKLLLEKLSELQKADSAHWGSGVLQLSADLDPNARQSVIDAFASPYYRVLIASTLASGEGLNLQFCSDCVVMERQWNPAKEEQVEGRFVRIGQQANKVSANYFIAVGTVDEFFSKIVEQKRQYVSNTLDGTEIKWEESDLMKELADVLAMSGGKRWNL